MQNKQLLEDARCAECGAVLPACLPKGLCARCAFDGALDMSHAESAVFPPTEATVTAQSSPLPEDAADSPPEEFGDYELLEEIARGGMGVVYKARQKSLGRIVAVKVILAGPHAGREFVERFRTEAAAAAILQHPNIVAIHEVGLHQGRHYFSMDYVDGPNLAQLAGRQPMAPSRAARCVERIAAAVHYAHERGILHRDLKPSNVLIDADEQPHVTDFGLAKRLNGNSSLTMSGQVLGSPNFMPPEQAGATHAKIGRASNVYALGGILYFLLTARAPFHADSLEHVISQVLGAEPVSPRELNASIPRDLETITLKCLEKEPARRYQTAKELADELGRFLRHEPILARPMTRPEKLWRWCRRKPVIASLIALLVVVGIAGVAGILWQWQRAERNAVSERLERERANTGESNALRQIYVDQMNLAQAAWELNDGTRLSRLLEETASSPERGFEWYYWQRQTHLEEKALRGHINSVLAVAYSRDGRWIVTGSADYTARVWDAASGRLMRTLQGHKNAVRAVAFSSDGQRIVTGSWDGTAMVWDATSGNLLHTLTEHENDIFSVAFSRDGERIATGSRDQTAKIWDAKSGVVIGTFKGHTGVIWSVAFSPDGERIVTGSSDRTAKVWAATNNSPLLTFSEHDDPVLSVAFSPDGERIVSGSIDKTARVWEAATGKEVAILEGHGAPVFSAVYSPDGHRIATAGDDQTARVWNAGNRRLLAIKKHGSPISSVAFSGDSQRIVTGGGAVVFSPEGVDQILARGGDRIAKVWEVSNEGELRTLKGHTGSVRSVAFSRDGQWIVTGSSDQSAKIREAASGRLIRTLEGHRKPVRAVAISPDGQRIVTGSWDGTAIVWDASNGQRLVTLPHNITIMSVAFSPDSRRIATAGQDPVAKVWDAASGKEQLSLKGKSVDWNWSVAFSPDGLRILTAQGNSARLWEAASGYELRSFKGHTSWLFSAAFSTDGRRIVTSSDDQTVRVWDADTGANLTTLNGHSDQIMSAGFSPDGGRIVSGSRDQSVRVWNATSGKELLTLEGRNGWVFSVAFSPDGKRIVAGNWDGTARVWEAASSEQVADWRKEEQAAAASQQDE